MKDGRRASESGLIQFERPPKRVKEWDDFVRRIWTYQWVRQPRAPDDEMLDTVFDLSQSIPDFVVLLFKLAQQRAMLDGTETLTPKLLRQTYDDALALLHPAINALRTNTTKSLSQYEDLLPVEEALAKMLEFPKQVTVVQDYLDQLFPVTGAAVPAAATEQSATPQSCDGNTEPVDPDAVDPELRPGYVDMRTAADEDDPHQYLVEKGMISREGINLGDS